MGKTIKHIWTKEEDDNITKEYIENKHSSTQIGEILDMHPSTILDHLQLLGVRIRTQSEAKQLYPCTQLVHSTPHTKEAKQKMSQTLKQHFKEGKIKTWNKGRKGVYSEETLKKMRIANSNRSKETIQKMAETLKRKYATGEIKINVAHLHTPEMDKMRGLILKQKYASGELIGKGRPKGFVSWNKGLKMSEEYKCKLSLVPHHYIITPEQRAKRSIATKKAYAEGRLVSPMKNPDSIKKMLCTLGKSPNKAELKLNKILSKLYPSEFKFVGDGDFVIEGRCPDFLNVNGKKIVIELFGEPFHDPNHKYHFGNKKFTMSRTEEATIAHYANYGFSTLVIWYKELINEAVVCDKIKTFMEANNNGKT